MDWISPVFTCTDYELTSTQIELFDLQYIGKEASCVNSTRVALFFVVLVMLSMFFIIWAFIFCTYLPDTGHELNESEEGTGNEKSGMEEATRKKDNYYKNIFTIVQNFAQAIMVGVAVLLSSLPALVYVIVLLSFAVLLFASIHVYARGCRIVRRRLNVVFYCTCILTTIFSLLTEAAPSGALAFSIFSLLIVIAGLGFSALVVWLGFGIGRKEEVDVCEKLMD